jgi:hypothetical protein
MIIDVRGDGLTYMFRHRAVTKAGPGAFRQSTSVLVKSRKGLK